MFSQLPESVFPLCSSMALLCVTFSLCSAQDTICGLYYICGCMCPFAMRLGKQEQIPCLFSIYSVVPLETSQANKFWVRALSFCCKESVSIELKAEKIWLRDLEFL